MEYKSCSDKYIWSADDSYFYKGLSELIVDIDELIYGRCEQVPDMRSSYSSGAHPRGTS